MDIKDKERPTLGFPPGREPESIEPTDAIRVASEKSDKPFSRQDYIRGMLATYVTGAVVAGGVDSVIDKRENTVKINAVHEIAESAREFAESPGTELVDSGSKSWHFRASSDAEVALIATDVLDRSTGQISSVEREEAATTATLFVRVKETEKGKTVELTTGEEWPQAVYLATDSTDENGEPNPPGQFGENRHDQRFIFRINDDADTSTFDSTMDALSSWHTDLRVDKAQVYTDQDGWKEIKDVDALSTTSKTLFDKSPNNPYGLDYEIDQQLISEVSYSSD